MLGFTPAISEINQAIISIIRQSQLLNWKINHCSVNQVSRKSISNAITQRKVNIDQIADTDNAMTVTDWLALSRVNI